MDPFVRQRLERIFKVLNDPTTPVTSTELNHIKIELNLLLDFYKVEEQPVDGRPWYRRIFDE